MNQALHIFRKDVRRFWPEIVASLLLVAGVAVTAPNMWTVDTDQETRSRLLLLYRAFILLVPVGWWFLSARAVQDESLVGDRQFWITRPYRWYLLLAAKALMVLALMVAPYIVAQLLTLHEAHFASAPYLGPVTRNALILIGCVVLPVFAIATVTRDSVRLILTLLGAFVVLLVFGFTSTMRHQYSIYIPSSFSFVRVILIVGSAAILVLQYATRRTRLARILLLTIPLLMLAADAIEGRQSRVDAAYVAPATGDAPVLSADVHPTPGFPVRARSWRKQDYVDVPLLYSGVPAGYVVKLENFRYALTGPDGAQWHSRWRSTEDYVLPGDRGGGVILDLAPELYQRLLGKPLALHVEFALTLYRQGATTSIPYPAGDVAVPGVGFCMPFHTNNGWLSCRSAVADPSLTYFAGVSQKGDCDPIANPAPQTDAINGWLLVNAFGTGVAGVTTTNLMLYGQYGNHMSGWRVCPGSPLSVTHYELVRRTRADMTVSNFQLPAKILATD